MPPTSPFRGAQTIKRSVDTALSLSFDVDSVFTVHENRGDFWRGNPRGNITRLFPDAPRRQQDREPLWEENSALYLTRVEVLKETGFILGRKMRAIPIDSLEGFDINTALDFTIAEAILQQK
ncbi:MAG: hypothetical protein ACXAC5_14565 [Promethearchaeota archaeon]